MAKSPDGKDHHKHIVPIIDPNVVNLGSSPGEAMGVIYQAWAHSTAIMFENAVNAQHNLNVIAQAATKREVNILLGVDVLEQRVAALEIQMSTLPAWVAALVAAQKSAKQAHA